MVKERYELSLQTTRVSLWLTTLADLMIKKKTNHSSFASSSQLHRKSLISTSLR